MRKKEEMPKTVVNPSINDRVLRSIGDKIMCDVSARFKIPVEYLYYRRDDGTCAIRACIATLLREHNYSLAKIGVMLRRDHSSIINILKWKINRECDAFLEIEKSIKQHLVPDVGLLACRMSKQLKGSTMVSVEGFIDRSKVIPR